MVNAGSLVNMAKPKKQPEIKTARTFFVGRTTNKIDSKISGSCIDSSQILLINQPIGITAKRRDAIKATFLL